LKKGGPGGSCVLLTSFNMFNKDLGWLENLTKFALHRCSMF